MPSSQTEQRKALLRYTQASVDTPRQARGRGTFLYGYSGCFNCPSSPPLLSVKVKNADMHQDSVINSASQAGLEGVWWRNVFEGRLRTVSADAGCRHLPTSHWSRTLVWSISIGQHLPLQAEDSWKSSNAAKLTFV